MKCKTFVVAYCQLATGELTQTVVTAPNAYEAICTVMKLTEDIQEEYGTLEELHELASDWDSFISVLET